MTEEGVGHSLSFSTTPVLRRPRGGQGHCGASWRRAAWGGGIAGEYRLRKLRLYRDEIGEARPAEETHPIPFLLGQKPK